MPSANITLPDGRKARITFDSQQQLDATLNDLVKEHAKKPPAAPREKSASELLGPGGDPVSRTFGELATHAVTGAAGAAAGGARGIFDLVTGQGTDKAVKDIQSTQEALTYQPRGGAAKAIQEVAQAPFTWLSRKADVAGEATSRGVSRVAQAAGASPETAQRIGAGAGAAVNVGIQSLPAAVTPALRAVRRAGVSDEALAARGAAVGEVSRGTSPGAPAGAGPRMGQPGGPSPVPGSSAPTPEMTVSGAPRQPPSTVGSPAPAPAAQTPTPPAGMTASGGARPTPIDVGGGALPQNPLEARAQNYARSIGLDWARLGAGTRKALTTIAQDATALDKLNPAAVRRQALLQGLRVPTRATRGQLERDPVQLRNEALASNTSQGQPIRDVDVGANRDLQANLEVLRGRLAGRRGSYQEPVTEEGEAVQGALRGPTKTGTQVGESAQGALREKAKWSKKGYQALYKKARETEPDAQVPLAPVQKLLTENPEIQHLGWVQSWLSKARSVLPRDDKGNLPELTDAKLAELHDLRSKANDIARTGGKEGYYAGQVVKAIDETMQAAPEGAAAWKRANEAFRKHQQEFKDQGIVSKLVNQKKGGADRALALEKTWKTVATGPLEQLRQVKKSLIKGENPQVRVQGAKAWRDLRAETVNRILEDARNVTGADETERAILTEAALRRSINRIPRENLKELLGVGAVRELDNILRARRITTRSPVGGRTTQSGTVPNALTLAEKALKHIPGVKYAIGAKHAFTQLGESGRLSQTAREATVSPLEQTARDVEKAQRSRIRAALRATLGTSAPTLSPGAPPPEPAPTISQVLNQTKPLGSTGLGSSQRGGPKFEPTIGDKFRPGAEAPVEGVGAPAVRAAKTGSLREPNPNSSPRQTTSSQSTKEEVIDIFGDGSRVSFLNREKGTGVESQTYPNGKTLWKAGEIIEGHFQKWPREFSTKEEALKSIKTQRAVETRKRNQQETYGKIPTTWPPEGKKIAKALIDAGLDVRRLNRSSQSKSLYIELSDGRKVRLSDHSLPPSYEASDVDFRFGGDVAALIKKLKDSE